ncbi:MAG: glycerate kinase [Chloroflexi bacterium]|nr:glycerate kinase [Chloroflexota bacterium]
MKIVIAPQAFKGTLSAGQAADAMAEAARAAYPTAGIVRCPMADGGDGTLDALVEATGGAYHAVDTTGPLGEPVTARWGALGGGDTAVVETAQACGLALLPPNVRDPLHATTYGVGSVIRAALDVGYRRIILGIGGSATNDGGAGLATSMGVRLLRAGGEPIAPGGAGLLDLAAIDASGLDARLRDTELIVATDVTNVLCGPAGAAATFGPQKGASPEDLATLDRALGRVADIARRDLGVDVSGIAGGGAAGGMGAGLVAFLGARLAWGADIVAEAVGLDARLEGAALVVTGEGRLDWQTAYHKAPAVVANRAVARGIPVLGVGGSLGPGWRKLYAEGFTALTGMATGAVSLEDAIAHPSERLARATLRGLRAMRRRSRLRSS